MSSGREARRRGSARLRAQAAVDTARRDAKDVTRDAGNVDSDSVDVCAESGADDGQIGAARQRTDAWPYRGDARRHLGVEDIACDTMEPRHSDQASELRGGAGLEVGSCSVPGYGRGYA